MDSAERDQFTEGSMKARVRHRARSHHSPDHSSAVACTTSTATTTLPAALKCCDDHHGEACLDDPPFTICCWRCRVNPSLSPELFMAAINHARGARCGR